MLGIPIKIWWFKSIFPALNKKIMTSIRVPVGSTDKDRDKFIEEFLRVFPNNTYEKVLETWEKQSSMGVLQMIIDTQTGVITHIMRINNHGETFWELSSRFINKIPTIVNYDPNDYKIENLTTSTNSNNTIDYNIDDILDFITENGYEKLTKDKKEFLAKYSKK
jgi:hypothetical protein